MYIINIKIEFPSIICFTYFTDYKVPHSFVQYYFDRNEHEIIIKPHGKSLKNKKPFTTTQPSTIQLLKDGIKEKCPKKVIHDVESIKGGVIEASTSCELPRNRRQVYNIKHCESMKKEKECVPRGLSSSNTGSLACVMQLCKDTIKTEDAFIRAVDMATEPMCVLATNQQLIDLERFCCGQNSTSVLSVDPTFNLGSFYVTPTTYQNLMIENDKRTHPLHLGPILIHHTKTLRPFHYFSSTIISCELLSVVNYYQLSI